MQAKKNLYTVLKQSPRDWFERFKKFVKTQKKQKQKNKTPHLISAYFTLLLASENHHKI